MKIAIVHDWLYGGGAEKVVEQMHRLYPDAPIYTVFATEEWQKRLDGKVRIGYLGRWPFNKLYKFTPLLQQWWFASLDLSDYDVVLSSSGNGAARFALSKHKRAGQVHISYTHAPTHYYWSKYDNYVKSPSLKPKWLARLGLRMLVGHLRKKDFRAAQTIDYLLANSKYIQDQIKQYYHRESEVVYPPVETSRFRKIAETTDRNSEALSSESPRELRCIIWGRHVPYKRFDIAVEACSKLGIHLDVLGTGPDTARLKKIAGQTVIFHGRVTDEEMGRLASKAHAFLSPQEEDFGIAPVEALAAGLPIIAYKAGGALDYVLPGRTGKYFEEQTVGSLCAALGAFRPLDFDSRYISKYAQDTFDNAVFIRSLKDFVDGHRP